MSSDKPPKGPAKPFLAEDDLAGELDAWDNMFDALHETGPAAPTEEPMAWPAPAPSPPPQQATTARVPEGDLSRADASRTLE